MRRQRIRLVFYRSKQIVAKGGIDDVRFRGIDRSGVCDDRCYGNACAGADNHGTIWMAHRGPLQSEREDD